MNSSEIFIFSYTEPLDTYIEPQVQYRPFIVVQYRQLGVSEIPLPPQDVTEDMFYLRLVRDDGTRY